MEMKEKKGTTPVRAIRAKCVECQGGGRKAIANCEVLDCPLHPYRMGKNPARTGIGGRKDARGPKI
jgi:hypothetical protein